MVLKTDRLTLRPPRQTDAAAIAAGIGDWQVVRWLTSPPWPYRLEDAQAFVAGARGARVWVIEIGGAAAGVIGCDPDLGYWLAPRHWRQGYMSEAVELLAGFHFSQSDAPILSGYMPDNAGSRRIQERLGFRPTAIIAMASTPLGRTVDVQRSRLERADWLARHPLRVETERLVLRPFGPGDLEPFLAIAGRAEVARMMASIPHPLSADAAQGWIGSRQFRGRLGFCAAIALKGGPLVGMVGIGGNPVTTAYFIDPEHWGRGFAGEALATFLAHVMQRFSLTEVGAAAMVENVASQRVLERVGFIRTGAGQCRSAARLEPAANYEYRLSRSELRAPQ